MKILYNPISQFIETKFSPYAGLWRMNFWQKCGAAFNLLNGNLTALFFRRSLSSRNFIVRAFWPEFHTWSWNREKSIASFGLFDYVTFCPAPFFLKLFNWLDFNLGDQAIVQGLMDLLGRNIVVIITICIASLIFIPFLAIMLVRSLATAVLVLLLSPIIGLFHVASQVTKGRSLKNAANALSGTMINRELQEKLTFGKYLKKIGVDISMINVEYNKMMMLPDEGQTICQLNFYTIPSSYFQSFRMSLEEILQQPVAWNAFLKLNPCFCTELLLSNDLREYLIAAMCKVYANSEATDFEILCFRALQAGHEVFATALKELSFVSDETRAELFALYFFGNEHIALNEAEAVSWMSIVSFCDIILCWLDNVENDAEEVLKLEYYINGLDERLNHSQDPEIQLKLYHIRLKAALLTKDGQEVIKLCQLPRFGDVSLNLKERDYFELGSLLLANQADQSLIRKIFYLGWHLKKNEDCFSILVRLLHQHDLEKNNQTKNLTQLSENDIHQLIEKYVTFLKNTPQAATSKPSPSHFSTVVSQKLPLSGEESPPISRRSFAMPLITAN